MKIRELLSSKDKWCQRAFAKDSHGNPVEVACKTAISFCLGGAAIKCYPVYEERIVAHEAITRELNGSFMNFNDTHTYEEVKALIDKLDI